MKRYSRRNRRRIRRRRSSLSASNWGPVLALTGTVLGDVYKRQIKQGVDPKDAYEKNISTYGRFAEAATVIDPRHQ